MMDINLEEIDLSRPGSWPSYLKFIIIVASVCIVYVFCNWMFITGKLERLENLKVEETRLRNFFSSKHKSLIDIQDYKNKKNLIESRLAKLVRKLPGANELPNLINQISQAGNESGLNFKEIKILDEKKFKYYVELPIKIKVDGDYHQISDFISKVTGMSRVVTFHDFNLEFIKHNKDEQDRKLRLEIKAKTYRYLSIEQNKDEDENAVNKQAKRNSKVEIG